MSGDYSKHRFDPNRDYSGVLMQQGRVQLDADWNEQVEIQDRRLEPRQPTSSVVAAFRRKPLTDSRSNSWPACLPSAKGASTWTVCWPKTTAPERRSLTRF